MRLSNECAVKNKSFLHFLHVSKFYKVKLIILLAMKYCETKVIIGKYKKSILFHVQENY